MEGEEKTGAAEILTPGQVGAQPDCGRQALRTGTAGSQDESPGGAIHKQRPYRVSASVAGWGDETPIRRLAFPGGTLRFGAADSQGESRCSESTGKIAYATLPAIEGWVADVAAGYEIDYVFGYVGGVVADAFEIFCYQD